MKVVLKNDEKLYLQKEDLIYLMQVEGKEIFSSYEEKLKDKKMRDFVLVEGKDLISLIKTHEEITDFVSLLLVDRDMVTKRMEYCEQALYCAKKGGKTKKEDLITWDYLYQAAQHDYVEKTSEKYSFFPLINIDLIDSVSFTNGLYQTYETGVSGLYLTTRMDGGHILDDTLLKEYLLTEKAQIMLQNNDNKKSRYLTKDIMAEEGRAVYTVIAKKQAKTLRKA